MTACPPLVTNFLHTLWNSLTKSPHTQCTYTHTHLNRGAFFHIRIQYFKICIGSLSLSLTVLKRVFYTIDVYSKTLETTSIYSFGCPLYWCISSFEVSFLFILFRFVFFFSFVLCLYVTLSSSSLIFRVFFFYSFFQFTCAPMCDSLHVYVYMYYKCVCIHVKCSIWQWHNLFSPFLAFSHFNNIHDA